MIRIACIAFVLLLALAAPVTAGPFEDGLAAYERKDYTTALKLWRPFAEEGDADAQHNLGVMYYNGEGVPQDVAEAVKWFRKAAEQGYAQAQNNLGHMYRNGQGVPQEDAEAVKWFRKAAEQGDAPAQQSLGYMYANGYGVPKDFVQAYMWSSVAAAPGNKPAQENRELFAKHLNPDQIAEAQRMAREWMAEHQR